MQGRYRGLMVRSGAVPEGVREEQATEMYEQC